MRYLIVLFSILFAAGVAQAREGFHMGLGGGFSSLNGDDAVPVIGVSGSSPKTSQGGGGGLLLRLGYNIMGYGALEGLIQGQADSLGIDGEESWAANWRLGTRIYPHWHWQSELPDYLQPVELSMFFGWGGTYKATTLEVSIQLLGAMVLVLSLSVPALSTLSPMSLRFLSIIFTTRFHMTPLSTIAVTVWNSMLRTPMLR